MTTSASLRFSFRVTSAALTSKFSLYELAIPDNVLMVHGTTTMPPVKKEPLANEANVWNAVERLHADLGLSARHITVSTVGIVPGIRTLADARGFISDRKASRTLCSL